MGANAVLNTGQLEAKKFLQSKLAEVLDSIVYEDLESVLTGLKENRSPAYLATAFSKAVRLFGKNEVNYSVEQYSDARNISPGWTPPNSIDKIVRVLILLEIPNANETEYVNAVETLFSSADLGEQVVIYSSLPLFSFPEKFISRCGEGIRSNMGEVFEAVANDNPFPALYLPEDAFNQMALKCLFVGKPLYKITCLETRLNESLARMASDYAHERWSAGREVNPELWQLVAQFLKLEDMPDMKKLSASENELEKMAAAICCSKCVNDEAEEIYFEGNYKTKIENGELNWKTVGIGVWEK